MSGGGPPAEVSIAALCVSGASFCLSVVTFFAQRRDKNLTALRDFLIDSAQVSDRLETHLRRARGRQTILNPNEELKEILQDFQKVAVAQERWHGETFDADFLALKTQVEGLEKTNTEYERSGLPIDDLKTAMTTVISASATYSKRAKEHLRR